MSVGEIYQTFVLIKTRIHQIGPGGLRSPYLLACAMRSLAIVITIVQSFFLSLSPLLLFFLRFLLLTHFGESLMCSFYTTKLNQIGPGGLRTPCVLACAMRSLAIVITIVQSLFLSLSSVFCFLPTSGNLPCAKICFPQYLGITRNICKK